MGSGSFTSRPRFVAIALFLCVATASCGGSSVTSPSPTSAGSSSHAPASSNSGDIVDTATYLRYQGRSFSIKYVEGWTIQQFSAGVVISDKDSSETVAIHAGEYLPLSKLAKADLARLSHRLPRFRPEFLRSTTLPAGQAFRAQYHTISAKDPVTGKQVPVVVDRYYLLSSSREATITLSTPVGVDNVDAFRLIARSYRWK